MDSRSIRFGPFCLDLTRRELSCGGEPVRLGSRALDILCVLTEADGEIVSKNAILSRVWPGLVVEENNIHVHISALRRELAQRDIGQSYIITVPGLGYRLAGLRDSPSTRQPSDLPTKASLAVLPFQNLSGDIEQEYFADGVVDDITTGLSRLKWLAVIARNSSFVYKGKAIDVKQAGRELGASYVLVGSVRKAGQRVRVNAQLIDAETGVHLWAERYDRLLGDIFALQDDIAISVIGAIEPSVRQAEIDRVRRKRPDSVEAYDLALQALPFVYNMMPESAAPAVPLLNKALELEPSYATAHALLAWCYHFRFSRGGAHEEDRKAAVYHARAAVTGGSDDATTLAIAGVVIWFDQHDVATAFDLFDRALALSNSNVVALRNSAVALAWMGKTKLAVDRAQLALRLSPFDSMNYVAYNALAAAAFHEQRYEDARVAAGRGIESNPGFSVPHLYLTAALVELGRLEEAQAEVRQVMALDPTFSIRRFSVTVGIAPDVFGPFAAAWCKAGLPE
jgi:TolB-like protein